MRNWQRLALALATTLAVQSPSFAADWTLTDLGTLPDHWGSGAIGVNNHGQAVGDSSSTPSSRRPVLFEGGSVTDLGTLGGAGASSDPQATDINDDGVIVGYSYTSSGARRAFVYSNGAMSDLGTLGGEDSVARAINDSGVIVGDADSTSGEQHAFVYINGTMTNIGGVSALGINSSGHVVGIMDSDTGFLYRNGVAEPLPGGYAYGINDRGLIVGNTMVNTLDDIKAAYYDAGGWHSIGTLGGVTSFATAINNRDQIVGYSGIDPNQPSGGPNHGFIYSNGVMHDINDLIDPTPGWSMLSGYSINDAGQITGSGWLNGQWRAFLLTPAMSTFELDATYTGAVPLNGEGGQPGAVSVKLLLEGIAGMPGTFRAGDVMSALVALNAGEWTSVDVSDLTLTLGPGGVSEILSLTYQLDGLLGPSGQPLALRSTGSQLQLDGTDPTTGLPFSLSYPNASQSLAVVPEPSGLVLAGMAALGLAVIARRRHRQR